MIIRVKMLFSAVLAVCIASCTKDVSDDTISFGGFYKIASIFSNQSIDINNDGIASNDLTQEIDDYFSSPSEDLEIMPNEFSDNKALLISFFFPNQVPVGGFPDESQSFYFFEKNVLGTSFQFIDNQIILNTNSIKEKNIVINDISVRNKVIEANFTKEYYDFKTQSWQKLDIQITYIKMDR